MATCLALIFSALVIVTVVDGAVEEARIGSAGFGLSIERFYPIEPHYDQAVFRGVDSRVLENVVVGGLPPKEQFDLLVHHGSDNIAWNNNWVVRNQFLSCRKTMRIGNLFSGGCPYIAEVEGLVDFGIDLALRMRIS
jgi:hypothetical protein